MGDKLKELWEGLTTPIVGRLLDDSTFGIWLKTNWEKLFGKGAKDAAQLEYIKTQLINMASSVIGMLKDAFNTETEKNGKAAIKEAKKISKDAGKDTAKAATKGKNLGSPAAAVGKDGLSATGKPILSTDIGKTIAEASTAIGKGAGAVISAKDIPIAGGKGIDIKAPGL